MTAFKCRHRLVRARSRLELKPAPNGANGRFRHRKDGWLVARRLRVFRGPSGEGLMWASCTGWWRSKTRFADGGRLGERAHPGERDPSDRHAGWRAACGLA